MPDVRAWFRDGGAAAVTCKNVYRPVVDSEPFDAPSPVSSILAKMVSTTFSEFISKYVRLSSGIGRALTTVEKDVDSVLWAVYYQLSPS